MEQSDKDSLSDSQTVSSESELAESIAVEMIAEIERYVDDHLKKYDKYTLNAPNPDSQDSKAQFFNLISSLKDVSILGRKLLEMAPKFDVPKSQSGCTTPSLADTKSIMDKSIRIKSILEEDATSEDLLAALVDSCSSSDDFLVLSSPLDSITTKDMTMAAFIYIKSHECFTLAHDINAVILVLRKTKFLILNILAPKNQMELITRLLTSIGRYSEMNYVFDLFRDRNQFEILLSKGVEKSPELRIALFNYVKKNPEFYALVTLNFSMFREIAESLEANAINRLNKIAKNKKIVGKKRNSTVQTTAINQIPNSSSSSQLAPVQFLDSISNKISTSAATSTQSKDSTAIGISADHLNLSLEELVDASDCFAKAGCYKRSYDCEKKAKLIAVQISQLPNGLKVLDLAESELNDLIVGLKSFDEAFILAEAYDYHLSWRNAIFRNVVQLGNCRYLESFCLRCEMSTALVMELVVLYRQLIGTNGRFSQEDSSCMAEAMKLILSKLQDVELRCKLYTQLNFEKTKENLLQNLAVRAHLRDLKLA